MSRPKGMPRKEWAAMGPKQKTRFLNFNISTHQNNSGTQAYGAGIKVDSSKSRKAGRSVPFEWIGKMPHANTPSAGPRKGRVENMRESLGKVAVGGNGTNFATQHFTIQPGIDFPWLSKVAQNYERYKIHAIRYEYVPFVGLTSTFGEKGRVGLAANYDALEGPPENLTQAETIQPHESGMASTPFTLQLQAARCTGPDGKFCRIGPVAGDLKTYDAGNVYLFTEGFDGTGEIGELYVTYQVELLNPRIGINSLGPCQKVAAFVNANSAPLTVAAGGITLYNNGDWSLLNSKTCLPISTAGGLFTLPVGVFFVNFRVKIFKQATGVYQAYAFIHSSDTPALGTSLAVAGQANNIGSPTPLLQELYLNATGMLVVEDAATPFGLYVLANVASPDTNADWSAAEVVFHHVG